MDADAVTVIAREVEGELYGTLELPSISASKLISLEHIAVYLTAKVYEVKAQSSGKESVAGLGNGNPAPAADQFPGNSSANVFALAADAPPCSSDILCFRSQRTAALGSIVRSSEVDVSLGRSFVLVCIV